MNSNSTTNEVKETARRMEVIRAYIAANFMILPADLNKRDRTEPLNRIRQLAMYLCRKHTKASLPDIAAAFGRGEHMTISHAIKATERRRTGIGRATPYASMIRKCEEQIANILR